MKILRIAGKNIASLAAPFEIDFQAEPLASSGLFAISGPTGAGKSTLLDALCLALYDSTPRLQRVNNRGSLLPDVAGETVSTQDARTVLRRGAPEAWAEVDFLGNDNCRYRARWSVRRARSKAAGALQPSSMTLLRLPQGQPLGGTKTEVKQLIEQTVGLSFEQFTRAVLLAQNEFSAFLKTDENERGELLETLTGSDIYSTLSRRAFERYKYEQNAMAQLTAQLSDQRSVPPDERAALEARARAANEAVAELDARRAQLEQQQRWQREAARLHENLRLAQASCAECEAALEAARARTAQLAMIDAALPARPLLDDMTRVAGELAAVQDTMQSDQLSLAQARLALEASATEAATAEARLLAAEQAWREAGPLLDHAKALDAALAALAPAHASVGTARDAARREYEDADKEQRALSARSATLSTEQQNALAWLTEHQAWEALATQWARWDTLLIQATECDGQLRQLTQAVVANGELLAARAIEEQTAQAAVLVCAQEIDAAQEQRAAASAACARFDTEQLTAERSALERARDALGEAEKIWHALCEARVGHARQLAQLSELCQRREQIALALEQAQAAQAPLEAALTQAERSLNMAELACAESVESLRATLTEQQACPVCGAREHPYAHDDPGARAMLASLRTEAGRCRHAVAENGHARSAARVQADATHIQLNTLGTDNDALKARLAHLTHEWDRLALAGSAALASEELRASWFQTQSTAVRAALSALDAQQLSARRAREAQDAAQHACDAAASRHTVLREAAARALAAHAHASARQAGASDKRDDARRRLAGLLRELDPAVAPSAPEATDVSLSWKEQWQIDPAQYHAALRRTSDKWQAQRRNCDERARALTSIGVEQGALAARVERAERALTDALSAFTASAAGIAAKRAERTQLFAGEPTQTVEAALSARIDTSRADLIRRQALQQDTQQVELHLSAALVHGEARLTALVFAANAADDAVRDWLAAFPARHPGQGTITDLDHLTTLIHCDRQWIDGERAALLSLDAALASAATIRTEREAQLAQHAHSAGANDTNTPELLAATLSDVLERRKLAADAAGALALELAQDALRRQQEQALRAQIDEQAARELRWGRLNELIGSADGKKFRNYAQQFTLDVLLGYANVHLAQLARRYRLARIENTAAPSLGLMVEDRDMGGELRSVHSLSGGESFLVSLALALGLASLSSNRVRVESLFIDEGFGSLDAETLRVAMDALDALQAMGRKVGVISHVHEMTERIATKILVLPAASGASWVSVQ